MINCEQCGQEMMVVPGKVLKRFCDDKCRKAHKRAELKKSKALTCPVVDELRTDGTKLSTSDNSGQPTSDKRGKDIKCFEDLHPGIQATIVRDSTNKDGKLDEGEKSRRTAIAVSYQHLYPERYEPQGAVCTGVVTGKPGDEDYDGICTPEWIAERKIG